VVALTLLIVVDNGSDLGLDLAAVEVVFVSHQHLDHSGGLPYWRVRPVPLPERRRIIRRRATGPVAGRTCFLTPPMCSRRKS
jgi:metal-dependent hydrolase (beta-lactamase superfamily II)